MKEAKAWVPRRAIIQAAHKPPYASGGMMTAQGVVHSGPAAQVEKIPGGKDPSFPMGMNTPNDLRINGL